MMTSDWGIRTFKDLYPSLGCSFIELLEKISSLVEMFSITLECIKIIGTRYMILSLPYLEEPLCNAVLRGPVDGQLNLYIKSY